MERVAFQGFNPPSIPSALNLLYFLKRYVKKIILSSYVPHPQKYMSIRGINTRTRNRECWPIAKRSSSPPFSPEPVTVGMTCQWETDSNTYQLLGFIFQTPGKGKDLYTVNDGSCREKIQKVTLNKPRYTNSSLDMSGAIFLRPQTFHVDGWSHFTPKPWFAVHDPNFWKTERQTDKKNSFPIKYHFWICCCPKKDHFKVFSGWFATRHLKSQAPKIILVSKHRFKISQFNATS